MISWLKQGAKEPARKGHTKHPVGKQGRNTIKGRNPKYYALNAEQRFQGFQQALKGRANQKKCQTGRTLAIIAQNAPESL